MKLVQSIGVWGDSVMKGVVYDENKSKYTLLSENGADKASRKLGLRLFNRSRMGCTVTKGLQLLKKDLQRPEAACDAALIEFGGNDCDYDWAQVAAHPEQDHQPKTPLPLFIAQLRDMIDLVRQKGMAAGDDDAAAPARPAVFRFLHPKRPVGGQHPALAGGCAAYLSLA